MKKVIIFDMDGVLFDTIPFARSAFIDAHPGVTEEMYNEIHSGNFHQEAAKYSHLAINESEEERQRRYEGYIVEKSKCKLFDGMFDLLQKLHNLRYTLVLNTNAHDKNCLPLLENAGIKNLFDFIAAAGISKDKVEKFCIIASKYQVDSNEMLFVTDALGDLRDADLAGVPTFAVTWGVHKKAYFEREFHQNLIKVIDTVAGLDKAIKENFSQ